MKRRLHIFILFLVAVIALQSCKKEITSQTFLKSDDVSVTTETRNAFLYKEVLIGTYDSTHYDSLSGTFYFNMDSLPVRDVYYYRITSIRNSVSNIEQPEYVTEFYFDSASAMHYNFISWYDYSAPYGGSTYGRTSDGWKVTFYSNTCPQDNYTLELYFKEFSHVGMPIPPLQ
jgi:hypothetical protein